MQESKSKLGGIKQLEDLHPILHLHCYFHLWWREFQWQEPAVLAQYQSCYNSPDSQYYSYGFPVEKKKVFRHQDC